MAPSVRTIAHLSAWGKEEALQTCLLVTCIVIEFVGAVGIGHCGLATNTVKFCLLDLSAQLSVAACFSESICIMSKSNNASCSSSVDMALVKQRAWFSVILSCSVSV